MNEEDPAIQALRETRTPKILSANHEFTLRARFRDELADRGARRNWRRIPVLAGLGVLGIVVGLTAGRAWLHRAAPTPEIFARATRSASSEIVEQAVRHPAGDWQLRHERIQEWSGGRSAFASYEIDEPRPVRVSWYVREN